MMSYTTEVTRPVPFEAVSTEDIAAADDNVLFSTIQNTTTSRLARGAVSAGATSSSQGTVTNTKAGYAKIKIPFPFDLLPDDYEDLKLVNVHVNTSQTLTVNTSGAGASGHGSGKIYLCKDTVRKSGDYLLTVSNPAASNSIDIPGPSGTYSWSKEDILDDKMYLYIYGSATASARYMGSVSSSSVTLQISSARSNGITATWAYYVSPPVINGEPIIITTTI